MRQFKVIEGAIRKNFTVYMLLRRIAPFICKFLDLEEGFSFAKKIKPRSDQYCILDIGSNDGTSIRMFRRYFTKVNIVAIDPIKTPRFVVKNVTLIKSALGEESGSRSLFIPIINGRQLSQYSSFYKEKMIKQICSDMSLKESQISTTVEQVTFNKVDDLGFAPFFIKIDVEGAELEVLKGALRVIKNFNPVILVEIQSNDIYFEIQSLLSILGYININPETTSFESNPKDYLLKTLQFTTETNNYIWINPSSFVSWQFRKDR